MKTGFNNKFSTFHFLRIKSLILWKIIVIKTGERVDIFKENRATQLIIDAANGARSYALGCPHTKGDVMYYVRTLLSRYYSCSYCHNVTALSRQPVRLRYDKLIKIRANAN